MWDVYYEDGDGVVKVHVSYEHTSLEAGKQFSNTLELPERVLKVEIRQWW